MTHFALNAIERGGVFEIVFLDECNVSHVLCRSWIEKQTKNNVTVVYQDVLCSP
jgi:hypothetical protein